MERNHLERLLRRVAETEPEEISCSECFDLLSTGVELELSGHSDDPVWRRLARHVGHCGVCREEYEILRDFVREEHELPAPASRRRGKIGPVSDTNL